MIMNAFIGGSILFVMDFFIQKYRNDNLVGFIYGFLPYTFLFLAIMYSFQKKNDITKNLLVSSAIGGIFFVIFQYIFYLSFVKYNLNVFISILTTSSSILFIIYLSDLFYQKMLKKSNQPNNIIEYLNQNFNRR